MAHRIRELAYLNRGLRITIDGRARRRKSIEFYYEGGIKSYVEHLNQNKEPVHEEPIFIEGEKDGISVEIAIQYNRGYMEKIYYPSPIISIRMKAEPMNQDSRQR